VIQHIVVWKLIEMTDEARAVAVNRFRDELSALVGVIPGFRSISITEDVEEIDSNADVVLLSTHDSRDALEAYRSHPGHVASATWWAQLVARREAVDSEI
jgi:heme-degrading monooxygenase HmoA